MNKAILIAIRAISEFLATMLSNIIMHSSTARREDRKRRKQLLEELFDPVTENTSFNIGEGHLYARSYISPLHTYALRVLIKVLYRSSARKKWKYIQSCMKWGYVDLERNVCSIGGPVGNQLVRKAMGYVLTDLTRAPILNLPMYFNLDKDNLSQVTRYGKGKPVEIPNWSIIDRDSGQEYTPEVDEEHLLRTDYLLITFMPNNLSKNTGRIHAIFSACHAPGLAAVRNVLESTDILEAILEGRKKVIHFQSLIKITRVRYTRRRLCMPVSVKHVKTIPLPDDI